MSRRPRPRRAAALLVALAAAAPAAARGPDARWRTVETAHFRVHYPVEAEAWSLRLATRLESIRAAVAEEVGYAPPQTVDVVVADPEAQANGTAWPLLGSPRMALWTTPPSASSSLGQLGDWGELLLVHEYAHLAHLLRPSRHPLRARLEPWPLPVGPLALGAPRWAVEGYATLVEGRLTGSGRPHSAFRAAVLRQWARQGRLPGYGRLASDRDGFLGLSMAYLGGSAFLEWLEGRDAASADALPRLWAAATARSARDFDAAFERVFGDRPSALWARFAAETTAAALARERELAPLSRQGELWLDRDGSTDELAVSPDGRRLAALVTDRRRPTRIVVWDLAAPPDGDDAAEAAPGPDGSDDSDGSDDPEDPAAVSRAPRRRRPEHELEPPPRTTPLGARFLADGRLLVGLLAPDRRGFRHADLALWEPGRRPRRLTRGADVRDADPHPDGLRAIGVRWRDGLSALVAVDLASGAVTELTPPALDPVHDRPRVSPAGDALAWLEHSGGRWRARVAPLDAALALGPPRELPPPAGGEPVDLAWRGDGSLVYAAVARGDELEIEALPVDGSARPHQVTRGAGASLAPAPTPDGTTLYFLALDADGLDVRRLPLDAATVQLEVPAAAAPDPPAPTEFAREEPAAPRPYGAGRAEWSVVAAGWLGDAAQSFEAGARGGDLLGRWELLALGALASDDGVEGGALRLAARPLPATLSLHLASWSETPADSTAGGAAEERETVAGELAARRELVLGSARLDATLGAGWARSEPGTADGTAFERGSGFVELGLARGFRRGRGRLDIGLGAALADGFADSEARHESFLAELSAAIPRARLAASWGRHRARGALGPGERLTLGGFPSSVAPSSARPGRVDHPALAPGVLVGEELESQRLSLAPGALPVALFGERHRADDGAWLRLWGLEIRFRTAPLPFLGVPGLSAAAGVARVELEGAADDDTRVWLGLVFPPRPGAVGGPVGVAAALD